MLKLLKQHPLSSLMMIVSIISLSLPVFAAPLPGAFIGSTITVGDTANTYAIADVNYLQGGLHSYTTLSQRNAITLERRHWGMLAAVTNDGGNNGTYQLTYNAVDTDITNNANWTLFSAGGGGGSITLQTDGTPNGSQTLLNLVGGSNVTLTDDGSGTVTIDASGGGGGGSQWDDVSGGINYAAGNVGIGTTAPSAPLHIVRQNGEYTPSMMIQNSTTQGQSDGTIGSLEFTDFDNQQLLVISGIWNNNNPTSLGNARGELSVPRGAMRIIAQTNIELRGDTPEVSPYFILNNSNNTFSFERGNILLSTGDQYINFDATSGSGGYGFRDNAGAMEFKDEGGSWIAFNSLGGGGGGDGTGPISIENGSSLVSTELSGSGSGSTATNAIFFGVSAGQNASNALSSIFMGQAAGADASEASNSLFIGTNAGTGAINATLSNFIGNAAGISAENANGSNFIGSEAGSEATNAAYSNFIGNTAGLGAVNATNSHFIGSTSGSGATNAAYSIFIGNSSGVNDTVDNTSGTSTSILIGDYTSTGGFSNSIALGAYATNTIENQLVIGSTARPINTIYIGGNHGTASADNTILIGQGAGLNGAGEGSVFIGYEAGSNAVGSSSIFLGYRTAYEADDAADSVLIGDNAANNAGLATRTVIIGDNAGGNIINATDSVLIGADAGLNAEEVPRSIFIGDGAGGGTLDASDSIFIGVSAGSGDLVDNSAGGSSILIGKGTSTGGFSNSIAIGENAINTSVNQFMIGSTTRPIDSTVIIGTAGTSCTITTGTSMSCSSDERLKTNIEDLGSNTLDKLLSVKTVSYNWISRPDASQMVGFLAQDLQTYFPELVTVGPEEYLQVNYAGMTPILVEALREINTKIISIADIDTDNTWRDSLTDWFASAQNGIGKLFAKEVRTEMLCVKKSNGDEVCIDGDQLEDVLGGQGTIRSAPQTPDPESEEIAPEESPETDTEVPSEDTEPATESETAPESEVEQTEEVVEETAPEEAPDPAPAESTV